MFGMKRDDTGEKGEARKLPTGTRRLSLRFMGQVQGVGFRWTSQRVADRSGCTGWVRNEPDGSVSMELQGTDDQIANFFGNFQQAYSRFPIDYRIDEKSEIEPDPASVDFRVRF